MARMRCRKSKSPGLRVWIAAPETGRACSIACPHCMCTESISIGLACMRCAGPSASYCPPTRFSAAVNILGAEKLVARIVVAQGDVDNEVGMQTLFQRYGKQYPQFR